MAKIFDNNFQFSEFHKKRAKFLKKISQNAKYFLDHVQKKTEQFEINEQRKRIEAFKAKEMDKYLDLLMQTKEKRIRDILEETENFLREIGIKIFENKGQN